MSIDVDLALQLTYFGVWRHKRYVNLLMQLLAHNRKTAAFNSWKLAILRRVRIDFQRVVFNRWRRVLQRKVEQKSIAKADIFHQKAMKNSLNNIFHEWILFSTKQKSLSQSLGDVREVANQDLLKNFIQKWADKYHSVENIVSAIDHTSNTRLMKRSFLDWKFRCIKTRNTRSYIGFLNQKHGMSIFLMFL